MVAKRRSGAAAASDSNTPGSKRQKVSQDEPSIQTLEDIKKAGLDLLEQIKRATDKTGRLIATDFLHLPDKKEYPDYYEVIALPIALDTIENKLNKHEYPTMTALESDLRRLVSNAKKYNDKSSVIFADAERIRKIVVNTMPSINPAYKDPNYVPFATPIPEEASVKRGKGEDDAAKDHSKGDGAVGDAQETPAENEDAKEEDEGFEGKTLQEAQDKIIMELIHLKDDDGREVSAPFLAKPDRNLYKEYYDVIQHPVSLRSLQRQVRGREGRKPHSEKTAFPTWQSFIDEVSYVWRNAREFNEEGSEIVELAGIVEEYFTRRVAEARAVVPDPPQQNGESSTPRIKLRMGSSNTPEPVQKLTLKMSGQGTTEDQVAIDSEALRRQQELVKAGSVSRGASTPSGRNLRSLASPVPSSGRESHDVVPDGTPNVPSGDAKAAPSTFANNAEGQPVSTQAAAHTTSNEHPRPVSQQGQSSIDSIWRKPGQDASHALIKNLSIRTHPSLKVQKPFRLDIPASPHARQQSAVVNLPPSHDFISLQVELEPNSPTVRSKLVAFIGRQKLHPTIQSHAYPSRPAFDVRLSPGLTQVDFQLAAIRYLGTETEKEFERLTVFFRVLR
ncbi:hypothetical protein VTN31DRAFT_7358 [Thermomyces dupontii]|uniref:uncharacterized protein n=1 Tax=Talaromyces thermophilus TaxID=28565 RepID=UPI0037439AF6